MYKRPNLSLLLQPGFQAPPVSCSAAGAVLGLPQARLQGRSGLLFGLRLCLEVGDQALQLLRLAAGLLLARRRALLSSLKALQGEGRPSASILWQGPATLQMASFCCIVMQIFRLPDP